MTPEARLAALGLRLPLPPPAVAASYVPWIGFGNVLVTSGQLPWRDGQLSYAGRLGEALSVEQGYEAARLCALNGLAQIQQALGNLSRVVQVVRVEGNVHSAPGFRGQPEVLNGASDLLNAVFGPRGRHTRTALGISEMPLDAAVQISLWVAFAGPVAAE